MATYISILTRVDRGAIAVVRVWGPDAIDIADSVFQPRRGRPLRDTPPGRLRSGRAGLGRGDEVVSVRLEATTPLVEIHCHGGTAAVAAVVRSLEEAGAVIAADPMEGMGRRVDRIGAQALADLASAPTLRTAEILLDQSRGALSAAMEQLLIDARHSISSGIAAVDSLIHRGRVGIRLLDGWKVVIAGRPNVGKSRLFNALAGFDRAIVNPIPGVTRDVISFRTAIAGWPVELCDTAGERETDDAVERLGIARSRREEQDADLVLVVLDRSEPLQSVDLEMLARNATRLAVANKIDLPPAWDVEELKFAGCKILAASAGTGEGLPELEGAIASALVPEPPGPGDPVPFRADHIHGLARARERLEASDLAGFALRLEEIRGVAPSR